MSAAEPKVGDVFRRGGTGRGTGQVVVITQKRVTPGPMEPQWQFVGTVAPVGAVVITDPERYIGAIDDLFRRATLLPHAERFERLRELRSHLLRTGRRSIMTPPVILRCAVCDVVVDPETMHTVHDVDCAGMPCGCDRVACVECCPYCVGVERDDEIDDDDGANCEPLQGPCAMCGGFDAAHRTVDAQMERIIAGEPLDDVADDYGYTADRMIRFWRDAYERAHNAASEETST